MLTWRRARTSRLELKTPITYTADFLYNIRLRFITEAELDITHNYILLQL